MNIRPLFFFVIAWVGLGVPARAQAPLPPFALALTLNDGSSDVVYRGWPLLVAVDAVLMEDVAAPFTLDPSTLRLVVQTPQGTAVNWPLRRIDTSTSPARLGPDADSARAIWVLPAGGAASLAPGAYVAKATWAGRDAPSLEFRVEPVPATLSADDQARRALLQSQALVLTNDLDGALAAVAPLVEQQPERIDLLVQQSRVHLARGEARPAFHSAQRALAIYYHKNPAAPHPPVSILSVESAAREALFKNVTPGVPPPGIPGAPPRTVTAPSTPAPTTATTSTASTTPPAPTGVPPANPTAPRPAETAMGVIVPAAELADAQVRSDATGQWAAEARAGSSYSNPGYAPAKATGAPNISVAGDSSEAWCPARQNDGTEWIELTFARPGPATGVRVRQTNVPGAITKVEAIEPGGKIHLWWEGKDPYVAPAVRGVAWFAVKVPATSYPVAKVKLTLDLTAVPGWKQIDAVQLVAAEKK